MSNWKVKEVTLDFSFLKGGSCNAVSEDDGINADWNATNYKRETGKIVPGDTLTISLASGGGWAADLSPSN